MTCRHSFASSVLVSSLLTLFLACHNPADLVEEKGNLQAFTPPQVQLRDGPFRHARKLDEQTVLGYETDRLLSRFRTQAGLEPKAPPYGGWEGESLAGHTLGHYLTACNLLGSSTGNPEFRRRSDYIVSELAACQQAGGDGYLGAFDQGKEIFETEIAQGDIRSQGFDLNGIWAPFYTHHKVLAGLRDAYRIGGNAQALEVARAFADWIEKVLAGLDDEQMQEVLHCEHGGMSEVLVDLYTDTGEPRYLELAGRFYHKAVLDPLVAGRDSLSGLHGNTQFPKLIGLAKRFQATGDSLDYRAASFFWDRVVNHHSYVTGGNTNHEYFGQPDQLSMRLGPQTTETCNVYNMLKLTDLLFRLHPTPEALDYYERAQLNHILASQHPQTGEVTYFLSLAQGGRKAFQDPFSFTCCVGSGMENHARYPQAAYYHRGDALWVAQFIASEVHWEAKGVRLTQETRFPETQGTTLRVALETPVNFSLKLRRPAWTDSGMRLLLNGEEVTATEDGNGFLSLDRTWQDGDRVDVEMPFHLRLEAMPDNPNRLAVCYGPLVLAGNLGPLEDGPAERPDLMPILIREDQAPESWLEPAGAPNTFRFREGVADTVITLNPLYTLYDQFYTVYWDLYTPGQWAAWQEELQEEKEAYMQLVRNTYDFFQPGEMQPERDHNYQGEDTYVVEMKGRKARQAERGGWFSFQMDIPPDGPAALVFEYWGGYTGSKTFDIVVDGQVVATENISGIRDGAFLTRSYPLPPGLTRGKTRVEIRISPHTGHRGGPVFGVRTLRAGHGNTAP
ncbi:glycoside hydrolase family 127 protein [Robiginitalea sp. M366]|uniref:glycoside hydrolase family 127 protein n=1 Tax=Robiginitalea aestuariiviva TaxID=3036903 RepID=UPI00240DC2C1|nr:glycoside hydrolase family 127 protein [Robiginitalea aestuariiviva]MDG1572677.1 glycoside hydrolase family 127 protein [Robiginitalea aestuariiviva]